MNNLEFKSTFDEIEYDIAMKMYMQHNDKIASINEHLGEMYCYKDLEDAISLETSDTLQEYKKALKEKCDAFDKVLDIIDEVLLIGIKDYPSQLEIISSILRGEDNETTD